LILFVFGHNKETGAMSEAHPVEQSVSEKVKERLDTPSTVWTLPAQHRRPGIVWLITLLIVLQVVIVGVVGIQVRKLFDLGERIERPEKKQTAEPQGASIPE
jgi:hypothetical protein